MKDRMNQADHFHKGTYIRGRSTNVQQVVVFQQNGSGLAKIAGIQRFGGTQIALKMISIDEPLPAILDDAAEFFPPDLSADLVLDYLKHPDLSDELARLCTSLRLPLIASGKKSRHPGVFAPPT